MILYVLNHDRLSHNPALYSFFQGQQIIYIQSRDLHDRYFETLLSNIGLVMIGGGEQHLMDIEEHPELSYVIDLILDCAARNITVIGICLGCQLIGSAMGAPIVGLDQVHLGHEFLDKETIKWDVIRGDPLLRLLDFSLLSGSISYHHDGLCLSSIPPDLLVLGKSHTGVPYIIKHKNLPIYGFQFHPEILKPHMIGWVRETIEWRPEGYYETIAKHFFSAIFRYLSTEQT